MNNLLKLEEAALFGLSIYLFSLLGHCAMDRIFGYGLKYGDSFHHTHLGWIKEPAAKLPAQH